MEPGAFYKFCPCCKRELEHVNKHGDKFICPVCGFFCYIDPIPVNGLILHDLNRGLLLVKRKHDPQKGKWDLTGGFLNIGENIEESVIREVKEELDIEVKDFRYLHSYPSRYLYQGTNWYLLSFIYYLQTDLSLVKVTAQDDAEEAAFFSFQDLPWDDIAFNGVKEALRDYATMVWQPLSKKI